MQIALNLRNAKQKDWALMFIFSIVSLILGVLIILCVKENGIEKT